MFDTRAHAEEAIERLVASRCPRDAITFLPKEELSEIARGGAYDWREDRWGLWRGLAAFEMMTHPDRYSLAEGINRGGSVLLVAAPDEAAAEKYGDVLVEVGAVDLDEREKAWRDAGWPGFDGGVEPASVRDLPASRSPKIRFF